MSKQFVLAILVVIAAVTLGAQQPPQQPMKLDAVQKALSLVDKVQPVPAKYKTGFEAITEREAMAMLAFVSSDWMEGRDTGSKGYALAADYVASLFKAWGIKPAGDYPPVVGGGRGRGGAPSGPPAARERTYFQDITFKETTDVQSSLVVESRVGAAAKTRTYTAGVDYQAGTGAAETIKAPVVFVGYGINEPSVGFEELKGLDLKGKIVLMLTEAPGKDNAQSPFQAKPDLRQKYFPPAGPGGAMMMPPPGGGRGGQGARFNKAAEIDKLGAAAILMVANTAPDIETYNALTLPRRINDERPIISRPGGRLTIAGEPAGGGGRGGATGTSVTVTREMANAILEGTGETIDSLKAKIEKEMKPASMEVGATVTLATTSKTTLVRSPNVLGLIEGSDPKLKDEYFVVGAHFDHNGRVGDYIWNGADDNGSGSIGVVAIAKAIAANPVKPKRSIIFALWTGEERGLYGSRYYVAHPTFPIAKTVGYLNYDMISRAFDEPTLARSVQQYNVPGAEALVKRIRGDRYATVSLTGGTDFVAITREMNAYVGLDLALRESPLGVGSGGSDHASFAAVKIPFVYYMTAMTPDYHQPSDSVEKVNGALFTKVIQMGYLTTFAYADRPVPST